MAVHMLGGTYWSKVYLLESGFEHPVNLKPRSGREGATDLEFVDLNNDGIYEAVAWDRRPEDLRCHFGMFGGRLLPEILMRDHMEYRPVWPLKKAGWHEVMTSFTDLDNDGTAEIVSLEDNRIDGVGAQRLAAYKMEEDTFSRIAKVSVPWPQIAYYFDIAETGHIALHTASQVKCKEGGIQAGDDTDTISYEFRNGVLQRLPSAPRQIITLKSPPLEFVIVPAGRFWMGCSPEESKCWRMELPRHEVEITRSFELGKYEVTQGQWIKIMGNNPSKFKGDDRRPIDNIGWADVQMFLKKLNAQIDGYIYRLPTEAEWEYAARAGSTRLLYGKLDEIAWYFGDSGSKTHPVGQKKPNGFGLYDMIGNVWEMCSDWEDDAYYANSPLTDPQGPSSGTSRIVRGLSVFSGGIGFEDRVSWRRSAGYSEKSLDIGFRLCRELR
jgi:formylglycine-generating enzyme required for sulfatase activity